MGFKGKKFKDYDHVFKSDFGPYSNYSKFQFWSRFLLRIWSKIGISNYWKVEQNRNWTHDHKFRREIVWTKIGFSNKVHHVKLTPSNTFPDQKRDPCVAHRLDCKAECITYKLPLRYVVFVLLTAMILSPTSNPARSAAECFLILETNIPQSPSKDFLNLKVAYITL